MSLTARERLWLVESMSSSTSHRWKAAARTVWSVKHRAWRSCSPGFHGGFARITLYERRIHDGAPQGGDVFGDALKPIARPGEPKRGVRDQSTADEFALDRAIRRGPVFFDPDAESATMSL